MGERSVSYDSTALRLGDMATYERIKPRSAELRRIRGSYGMPQLRVRHRWMRSNLATQRAREARAVNFPARPFQKFVFTK